MRNILEQIEEYGFECEAGALENCTHWIELKNRVISYLVDAPASEPEVETSMSITNDEFSAGMEMERFFASQLFLPK